VSWAEQRLLGRCGWEKEKGERAGLLGRGGKRKEGDGLILKLGWAAMGWFVF